MKRASLILSLAALGCGSPQPAASPEADPAEEDLAETGGVPKDHGNTTVPDDVLAKVARPFTGYRIYDQKVFSREMTVTMLASADAICFGEAHDNPLDHFAELELFRGLAERRKVRGFELLVGLEMFRTEFQPNLDYFYQNPAPFAELAPKVNWDEEWGYPHPYYAPIIEAIGIEQARMIALGVGRQVSRTVARGGIAALPPERAGALPDLDLGVAEHRTMFDESMEGHPPVKDINNYYQVQVIWDESMAERSVLHLADRSPARKMLIFAGHQHCHRSAIPARMKRRAPHLQIASVRTRETSEKAEGVASGGYDFELIF